MDQVPVLGLVHTLGKLQRQVPHVALIARGAGYGFRDAVLGGTAGVSRVIGVPALDTNRVPECFLERSGHTGLLSLPAGVGNSPRVGAAGATRGRPSPRYRG